MKEPYLNINKGNRMTKFNKLLKDNNITSQFMADKLGVSKQTIESYRVGRLNPASRMNRIVEIINKLKEI